MARSKNPKFWKVKECPTCKNSFETRVSREKTFCSKKCSNNDPIIKETNKKLVAETFQKKYGAHPMTLSPTKEKLKASLLEKYGVKHYSQHDKFRGKVKFTLNERYGDENYNNIRQIEATCLERYGHKNYRLTDEYKTQYKKTCIEKFGVEHSSNSKQFKDAHKRLMFTKFLTSEDFTNFTPLFSFDEYEGVTQKFDKKYKFQCKRCPQIIEQYISDGKRPICPFCDKNNLSTFQLEVLKFIQELIPNDQIIVNDKSIVSPKEIDILIPHLKIGIECDGVYWHGEGLSGKNKNYHLYKSMAAMAKGIRLVHIFDTEWKSKPYIVKSILRSMILPKSVNKIYARLCELVEISSVEANVFFEKTHLQGKSKFSYCVGLKYNGELVSVMGYVKPRFNKLVEWELGRYANQLDITVLGGAEKLFAYFIKTKNPSSIISYCDRRYFSGNVYNKLKFKFTSNTQPSYFYIIKNILHNRMSWMKSKLHSKLSNFDPNLTEWENMQEHGYDRVWDCGHSKWIWTPQI
jgi:rubrerythrin